MIGMKKMRFSDEAIKANIFKGHFGLEIESLRVDERGFLAQTKHPFGRDPRISRDFCENQVEIITGVGDSPDDVLRELTEIQRFVAGELLRLPSGPEYLWPFSNPPFVKGEDDIPIAHFGGDQKEKDAYRRYLAGKYGKMLMLFSGIHFNYSFSDSFLTEGWKQSGMSSFRAYKDRLYLDLAGKLTQYSWLIVYLTAASSVCDDSFLEYETIGKKYASPRCSEIGYWNDFVPVFDYASLDRYVDGIKTYVAEGKLISAAELYYPIRLKPRGENDLNCLRANGVDHIELRMLDLNPLSKIGIYESDFNFLQLLILFLVSSQREDFPENEQITAVENMKKAAEYDVSSIVENGAEKDIKTAALNIIDDMRCFYGALSADDLVRKTLAVQREKVLSEEKRYAVTVRKRFGGDYLEKGLSLSKERSKMI
jgi:glutamate--cysteine ligase